ncbi:toprim domain-containing protein [Marivita sp.]|uniref:DUF7146 domain-containing protein n=1 Tax=Marivita sp. TaxID=2003365 RepID=UPI00261B646D|nr:toprim domain-containing protein [Marivita sp.]
MTDARDLTSELGGKWYQRYGVAPCPVCQPQRGKRQNALTLSNGRSGQLILHCKKSGCEFTDILAASGLLSGGYTPPYAETLARREAEQRDYAKRRAMQAAQLWKDAKPINGTPAETYLRGRGISCPLPDTLRFHPECWHGPTAKRYPAMVALVTGGNGAAIHRTYLASDGRGKAAVTPPKAMLGATKGGAVRLAKGPGPLLVGEGIESSFSALILHGDKTATAFAALSTSGMRGLQLPSVGRVGKVEHRCSRLIIAVDGEKAGRDAGRELAERATGLGWQVSILDPGDGVDFNDRLIEDTRHEHF